MKEFRLNFFLILWLGEPTIRSTYNDALYGGRSLWTHHCSTTNPGSALQPTRTGGLNAAAFGILHYMLLLLLIMKNNSNSSKEKKQKDKTAIEYEACLWKLIATNKWNFLCLKPPPFLSPSVGPAWQKTCSGKDTTLVSKSTSKTGPVRGLLYLWTRNRIGGCASSLQAELRLIRGCPVQQIQQQRAQTLAL